MFAMYDNKLKFRNYFLVKNIFRRTFINNTFSQDKFFFQKFIILLDQE